MRSILLKMQDKELFGQFFYNLEIKLIIFINQYVFLLPFTV